MVKIIKHSIGKVSGIWKDGAGRDKTFSQNIYPCTYGSHDRKIIITMTNISMYGYWLVCSARAPLGVQCKVCSGRATLGAELLKDKICPGAQFGV